MRGSRPGVLLGLPTPASGAELEEDKTETGCPGAWWFSVSDFPLKTTTLSMYIEYVLRKEQVLGANRPIPNS